MLNLKIKKTSTFIHQIWNKEQNSNRKNRGTLQLASVQVLHTAPHFTARGFFDLNRSLIHMVTV